MSKDLTPKQFAEYLIRTVQNQGCCYDLLPELSKDKIVVRYLVDGDRIGWYESSRNFGSGLPVEFLRETIKCMKQQLVEQEIGLKESYWKLKKQKKVNHEVKSAWCL
jgi:hypothetical protein